MTPSFAQFRTALQALVCGCVLALTACASTPPPTAELAAAQRAVASASEADADHYAPQDVARARSLLARAQSAMADGNESDARDLALLAGAAGSLALARSREATTTAELEQRRAEIANLRQNLGLGDAQ